ncbi:methyltransferase domain-containing protein [Paenibacillus humicus]|uniref:methyltransferase domain-containing protein n=1 Tax=Paenibacillus humicus TaxID=412861 RepID=UPI003D2E4231
MSFIRSNRRRFIDQYAKTKKMWYFSGSTLRLYKVMMPIISNNIRGRALDAGCGNQPFRDAIEEVAASYESLDIEKRVPDVTYTGDLQNASMIPDNSFDSVVCSEVLEHVPDHNKAISELYRMTKKDGVVICTVPHLSGLHEEPYDFFRFTKYGLKFLFEKHGFREVEVIKAGGLVCFLNHLFSLAFIGLFFRLPIVKQFAFYLNSLFAVISVWIDETFDRKGTFALGYIVIARK